MAFLAFIVHVVNYLMIMLVNNGRSAFLCGDSSTQTSVINICSPKTVTHIDASRSHLLRVSEMRECECVLSVMNQTKVVSFNLQPWHEFSTSTPSNANSSCACCGVSLKFEIGNDSWSLRCKTSSKWSYSLNLNQLMTITTDRIEGQLQNNEGYCVQLNFPGQTGGQYAQLECGMQSSTFSTPLPLKSTSANQDLEISSTKKLATTTQEKQTTGNQDLAVSSTTESETSGQTKQTADDAKSTLGPAIGATIGGLAVIVSIVVILVVFKRKRKKKRCRNYEKSQADSSSREDGLEYNVLYQPSDDGQIFNSNEVNQHIAVNSIPVQYDLYYATVDPNDVQSTSATAEFDRIKGKAKPQIAKKPEHLQEKEKHSNEISTDVESVSVPNNEACEYAVVNKRKDVKNKRSERPSTTINYTAASGDVYAAVNKSNTLPASASRKGESDLHTI